jgi:hypothetical protein
MALLSWPVWDAVEIGLVADDMRSRIEYCACFRCDPRRGPRTETDNGQCTAARTFEKFRPSFMMTAASVARSRSISPASGSVPGNTSSVSSPQAIGSAAAAQHPAIPVTPGTSVTG